MSFKSTIWIQDNRSGPEYQDQSAQKYKYYRAIIIKHFSQYIVEANLVHTWKRFLFQNPIISNSPDWWCGPVCTRGIRKAPFAKPPQMTEPVTRGWGVCDFRREAEATHGGGEGGERSIRLLFPGCAHRVIRITVCKYVSVFFLIYVWRGKVISLGLKILCYRSNSISCTDGTIVSCEDVLLSCLTCVVPHKLDLGSR